jgi:prepilin-type N-terminal cleavage/methylation domain-containing protein
MKRRKDRAFTLIEVLVALAILAIVLVALLRMEINSVSLSARTSISFRALLLAVRETDELELRNFNGEYEKEIDDFTVKARTELTSQKGIPFEKMSLQVLYGSSDYADINTFKLKL